MALNSAKNKKYENGFVSLDGTEIDYVRFGNGHKTLIIIPGLGDGLRSVKGTASLFSLFYSEFAKNFKVYIFSRKRVLPKNYSTKDMADDVNKTMDILKIEKAFILGISMGGMISQHFALNYPEKVEKLVLIVTSSKPNETLKKVIGNWYNLAVSNSYKELMINMAELMYTDEFLKFYKPFLPLVCAFGKPKSYSRYLVMAKACINHNAYSSLHKITSETIVIAGDNDKVLSTEASIEIAKKIPNSTLRIFKNYGHGLYEETKNYQKCVVEFLNNND